MQFGFTSRPRPFGFNAAFQGSQAVSNYAAWPNLVGAEMILEPLMGSATGWNLGAGMAIALGKQNWTAVVAGVGATNGGAPAAAFVSEGSYIFYTSIDSIVQGKVQISLGDGTGQIWEGAGSDLFDLIVATDPIEDFKVWNPTGVATTCVIDAIHGYSYQGMGQAADWAFTGATGWSAGAGITPDGVYFSEEVPEGDKAELTGTAKTAFDAAVSNSTACSVSVTIGGAATFLTGGTIAVALKGGAPVNFVFTSAGETVAHNVTSGTGSGFEMTAGNDTPEFNIDLIRITLA